MRNKANFLIASLDTNLKLGFRPMEALIVAIEDYSNVYCSHDENEDRVKEDADKMIHRIKCRCCHKSIAIETGKYSCYCENCCSIGEQEDDEGNSFILNQAFDAQVWVNRWLEVIEENPSIPTDEGAMLGWFANAIMCGYDYAMKIAENNAKHETGRGVTMRTYD